MVGDNNKVIITECLFMTMASNNNHWQVVISNPYSFDIPCVALNCGSLRPSNVNLASSSST